MLRAKWSVRIEDLSTRLVLGEARQAQAVIVNLVIEGLTPEAPSALDECMNYAPICDWITREWPKRKAATLIEGHVNELLLFLFAYDKRVQSAWVCLHRAVAAPGEARISIERKASRAQFQSRLRALDA